MTISPACASTTRFSPSRFTGKERDTESGNDYFGARYYSSAMGRFMSPDWSAKEDPVPYAQLDDPQSLNLYAYVRNNPLTRADADGHCGEDACVLEGGAALYFAGAAALAGTAAVLSTPAGQRSFSTFANAASANFSSNVSALKSTVTSLLSKKDAPAPTTGDKTNPTGPAQPKSNPWTGTPGSTSTTTQPDGSPKQTREYGPDGKPKTDVDYGHDHGQGDPHAHDFGRPSDGSPPTAADRAPGRPVQPTDPKPQPPPKPQP
jgi:RHS repeat-associated protein